MLFKKWLNCKFMNKSKGLKKIIRFSEDNSCYIKIVQDNHDNDPYFFIYVEGQFPDNNFATYIEELTLNNKTNTLEQAAFFVDLELLKNGYNVIKPFFLQR